MKRNLSAFLYLAFLLFFVPGIYAASNPVTIYFFWGDGCPHCNAEKPFLEQMKAKYPSVTVKAYETWKNQFNNQYYQRMSEAYKLQSSGVPGTFIGGRSFIGFAEEYKADMEKQIAQCVEKLCVDPHAVMENPALLQEGGSDHQQSFTLPVVGTIDPEKIALPLLTIIIGGLDSINPCAFFVLFVLLGMLIHARSRKRMLFIGLVFVFFSGLIYFLFMAAWFNLFHYMGNAWYITAGAAIVALIIALINIKDFFFLKKGVSLTIPEKAKPKLFDRMRKLLKADSLVSMVIGTVVLAVLANTYELLCTAGFPMVYTKILTQHQLPTAAYYLYLVLYNVIYVIPLFIIVIIFSVTLGSKKLTENQVESLKLISGLMMLALGLILLIQPTLLANVLVSLFMLIGVLTLSLVLIRFKKVLHRRKELKRKA